MKYTYKQAIVILILLLVTGCASGPKPLYYWGSYQNQLYGHLKGESSPDEQIAKLEEDIEKAASENLPLPPGFQAHLALLYGDTGNSEKMRRNLEAEKQQFPESSTFIDFLLKKFK
jgi:hypothetical protein